MKKSKEELMNDVDRLEEALDSERLCTLGLKNENNNLQWELNLQKTISRQIYERLEKLVAALEIERASRSYVGAELVYSKELLALDTYKGKRKMI